MYLATFIKTRTRQLGSVAIGIAAVAFLAARTSAQTPSIIGTWEMDAAKSQANDGRTIALTIESVATNKLKLTSITHPKTGTDISVEVTCTADGKSCDLKEGDHKSQVSMWYLGGALNICKTDGPPGDVVNEWKLQPSVDGKQLTLTVTHIDPSAAEETLVFSKKAS